MRRWTGLEKALFAAFLFWSACGLVFTLAALKIWQWPDPLRAFVYGCVHWGDPVLILLAFANTHLHASRAWSPAIARRWALIVLVAALIVETVGVRTGFPFGAYRYTDRFGPMLGLVPFVIPLAWHVVVTNALFLARRFAPGASRALSAVITGLICVAYDFALEPFATLMRQYWLWKSGVVPWTNYASWFVIGALLAGIFAPRTATTAPRDWRPVVILAVMLLIFLAGIWHGSQIAMSR